MPDMPAAFARLRLGSDAMTQVHLPAYSQVQILIGLGVLAAVIVVVVVAIWRAGRRGRS
jgi:hypothetical protein